jgi:predicted ATPase with chaperone activity
MLTRGCFRRSHSLGSRRAPTQNQGRKFPTAYILDPTTYIFPVSERVRSAIQNSGLEFPNNKRITVNLAPADLPKDSGRFDLPIALGILAASGQIDATKLLGHEFAGELSLSGELRSVRGALAMSLALHTAQVVTQLVLPPGSAEEAALVPDAQVYRAQHLLDVVQHFLPDGATTLALEPSVGWTRLVAQAQVQPASYLDMMDVKGQSGAKRALEIAAAGGHSLLMLLSKDPPRKSCHRHSHHRPNAVPSLRLTPTFGFLLPNRRRGTRLGVSPLWRQAMQPERDST